ncbi:DUF1853 family protein [Agitococcus lubricus]|uniref:DUF1853 family protein n=1 Tax=Agitococcus lubricus TaxID=1077255 RepID=A0A2T5J3X1_9GAMM|nr:DUF1853 family protein [Agitococcus lubricus]PTQ91304.1 hypothetical protein C8N29_101377 [Agitococcus lubricus]
MSTDPNIEMPWFLYAHPHVRNLAWVLASPSLLSYLPDFQLPLTVLDDAFWQRQYVAYQSRLHYLDAHPHVLDQFFAQHHNHRLGYYFEYLLLFWLQDSAYHSFRLIKHRATLFQDKTTVGELDFVVKNQETGDIEHWEVAIKFYLGYDPLTQAESWLGANDNDSLARKLQHLATKQFRFSHYQDNTLTKRCLIVKGRLFYPLVDKSLFARAHSPTVPCLADQHLQGNWLMYDDFLQHPDVAQLQWRQAAREEWLTHHQPSKQLALAQVNDVRPLSSERAALWIGFDDQQQEQARCFVRVLPRP